MKSWLSRDLEKTLLSRLQTYPIVALLGSRQVGKTTLAYQLRDKLGSKPLHYLDLETDEDLAKLSDPADYLERFKDFLVIIDEVQRKPVIFKNLRSIVDARIREGHENTQFLLLGSASRDLVQHSSETLAGRISYLELPPFLIKEVSAKPNQEVLEKLWFRGGYPKSFLAASEEASWLWRGDFIDTYLERDIPRMGPNLPAQAMKRLWTMLGHTSGRQVSLSVLGRNLGVSHTTVRNYLDTLQDFYMLRELKPWSGNVKSRLVKSPKIYVRDSGLLHRLLGISSMDYLLGHPAVGGSWEGFVVENIMNYLSSYWSASYFRTSTQQEIDLVLEKENQTWAIEIKRSQAPKVSAGFYKAAELIKATRKVIIYSGEDSFKLKEDIEVMGLFSFIQEIQENA